MTVLIDTSYLLALALPIDRNHALAKQLLPRLNEKLIIPIPVLPELFYMLTVRAHYPAAVKMMNYLGTAGFAFETITLSDQQRMNEIMRQYMDVRFDFVDVSIMALAERLGVSRICTFDRRDFSVFRPAYSSHLELLP